MTIKSRPRSVFGEMSDAKRKTLADLVGLRTSQKAPQAPKHLSKRTLKGHQEAPEDVSGRFPGISFDDQAMGLQKSYCESLFSRFLADVRLNREIGDMRFVS